MAASKFYHVTQRIGHASRLAWQGLNHLLWPAICINCGVSILETDRDLCPRCWSQLMTCAAGDYCPRCGRDASRYGLVAGACPACQQQEFHFDGIARAGVYRDALQQMILAFKHDRTDLLSILAPLANAALQGSPFYSEVDLFVPVPLHWTRRLLRGYNQSHLIAKSLDHPHARVSTDLVRVRRTQPQPTAPTFHARARNVAGAFAVRKDHPFTGRVICLIDDIKTSGATLSECAKTLKEAGATKVYSLVLAVAGQKSTSTEIRTQATEEPADVRTA